MVTTVITLPTRCTTSRICLNKTRLYINIYKYIYLFIFIYYHIYIYNINIHMNVEMLGNLARDESPISKKL